MNKRGEEEQPYAIELIVVAIILLAIITAIMVIYGTKVLSVVK